MSRRQRLYSAVVSSYVQLGVSAAFTLGSVRLALDHLPRAHFGLWGLVLEITGVLLVLDFGLPAAFARLLIDEKDREDTGRYERLLYAALLFFALQGLVLLAVALVTLGPLPGWLGVDVPSRALFRDVLIGQALVAAAMCVGRYPGVVLLAHHRMDLANLGSAAGLAVNLGVLALALRQGAGVMSFVHGSAAGLVVTAVFTIVACRRVGLRLLPSLRARPTRQDAREVLGYGVPVMVINLGVQLIFFTRTTVVSRALGLDAAGVWAVCNRPFNLFYQLCWKPADMAFSLFSEMVARNEREHLRERFLEVFRGTLALTATAGWFTRPRTRRSSCGGRVARPAGPGPATRCSPSGSFP